MLLVLSGALLSVSSAEAQRVVAAGDTVRVQTTAGGPSVKGRVREVTGSHVFVMDRFGADQSLAALHIARMEVLQGRRSGAGRGALMGLVLGGAIGTFGGLIATTGESGWMRFGPEIVPLMAGVFGAGGALAGAILGALVPRDRWVSGQLPPSGPSGVADSGLRITPVVMSGAGSTWRVGVRLR